MKLGKGFTLISAARPELVEGRSSDMKVKLLGSFTLIELLVVIAVAGILIGITIPSLISFNRRQQLKNSAAEVISALRFAQSKALSAELSSDVSVCPPGPTDPVTGRPIPVAHLQGWYASFPSAGISYSIAGRCALSWDATNLAPLTWGPFDEKEFVLPQSLRFNNSTEVILFSPITQSVKFYDSLSDLDNPASPEISPVPIQVINPSGDTIQVEVTSTGEIK